MKGTIKEAELEKEAGRLIWSFDVETKTGIREIWVDPYSGKIVTESFESSAKERSERRMERGKKRAPAKASAKPKPQ